MWLTKSTSSKFAKHCTRQTGICGSTPLFADRISRLLPPIVIRQNISPPPPSGGLRGIRREIQAILLSSFVRAYFLGFKHKCYLQKNFETQLRSLLKTQKNASLVEMTRPPMTKTALMVFHFLNQRPRHYPQFKWGRGLVGSMSPFWTPPQGFFSKTPGILGARLTPTHPGSGGLPPGDRKNGRRNRLKKFLPGPKEPTGPPSGPQAGWRARSIHTVLAVPPREYCQRFGRRGFPRI